MGVYNGLLLSLLECVISLTYQRKGGEFTVVEVESVILMEGLFGDGEINLARQLWFIIGYYMAFV